MPDDSDSGGTGNAPGEIDLLGGFGGEVVQEPSGEPEVCDGKDNDNDGKIDNVDAGGDGICDCLNIATIGHIGPWSDGGDIFEGWLNARSPRPAFEIGNDELTPEILAGLDVIVVLRADTAPLDEDDTPAHHAFADSEVDALSEWVRAGGGLMTTIGYQSDETAEVENVNRLLDPLDTGYDPERTQLNRGFLEDWDRAHPIANGVAKIKVENGVEPLSSGGTIVARGEDEMVAVVAQEAGDGRVIVFGDEWITYDSEWVDTEGQQVELLWLNMIKWLSPPKRCQVEIPPELVVR